VSDCECAGKGVSRWVGGGAPYAWGVCRKEWAYEMLPTRNSHHSLPPPTVFAHWFSIMIVLTMNTTWTARDSQDTPSTNATTVGADGSLETSPSGSTNTTVGAGDGQTSPSPTGTSTMGAGFSQVTSSPQAAPISTSTSTSTRGSGSTQATVVSQPTQSPTPPATLGTSGSRTSSPTGNTTWAAEGGQINASALANAMHVAPSQVALASNATGGDGFLVYILSPGANGRGLSSGQVEARLMLTFPWMVVVNTTRVPGGCRGVRAGVGLDESKGGAGVGVVGGVVWHGLAWGKSSPVYHGRTRWPCFPARPPTIDCDRTLPPTHTHRVRQRCVRAGRGVLVPSLWHPWGVRPRLPRALGSVPHWGWPGESPTRCPHNGSI
jgi:hypothetical protein